MQSIVESKANKFWALAKSVVMPLAISLLSIGVVLLAIFGLASWAEAAAWHHATQHVLIFGAGIGMGSTWALRVKKERL